MSGHDKRRRDIFFELYEGLPRQGPGSRASAERALAMCAGLPEFPRVLDLGCGTGGQTLYLAGLLAGPIIAVDTHVPSIERLRRTLADRGLADRVTAQVADMAEPGQPEQSFDLIWSEGALYSIGLAKAFAVCRRLLRPSGYLAFTDAVWRKANPPEEVAEGFREDYPGMGGVDDVLAAIDSVGLEPVGHFTLPEEAWWDDFYTPMEARIAELRSAYSGDRAALNVLDELAAEPEIHRRYSDYYAYEFFVARRAN